MGLSEEEMQQIFRDCDYGPIERALYRYSRKFRLHERVGHALVVCALSSFVLNEGAYQYRLQLSNTTWQAIQHTEQLGASLDTILQEEKRKLGIDARIEIAQSNEETSYVVKYRDHYTIFLHPG